LKKTTQTQSLPGRSILLVQVASKIIFEMHFTTTSKHILITKTKDS